MSWVFNRYFLISFAVAALCFGAYAWRQHDIAHWKNIGRQDLLSEQSLAQARADEKTRARQKSIGEQLRKAKDENAITPGADDPAPPYLRNVVKRMRAFD